MNYDRSNNSSDLEASYRSVQRNLSRNRFEREEKSKNVHLNPNPIAHCNHYLRTILNNRSFPEIFYDKKCTLMKVTYPIITDLLMKTFTFRLTNMWKKCNTRVRDYVSLLLINTNMDNQSVNFFLDLYGLSVQPKREITRETTVRCSMQRTISSGFKDIFYLFYTRHPS